MNKRILEIKPSGIKCPCCGESMKDFNIRALKDYDEEHPLIASHWLHDDDNGHGESHHTIKIYFDDKFCYFKIEKMEIYPYETYWGFVRSFCGPSFGGKSRISCKKYLKDFWEEGYSGCNEGRHGLDGKIPIDCIREHANENSISFEIGRANFSRTFCEIKSCPNYEKCKFINHNEEHKQYSTPHFCFKIRFDESDYLYATQDDPRIQKCHKLYDKYERLIRRKYQVLRELKNKELEKKLDKKFDFLEKEILEELKNIDDNR